MSKQNLARVSRRALRHAVALLGLAVLLAGCSGSHDADKPSLQGKSATNTSAPASASTAFALASANSQSRGTRTALSLDFSARLASAQDFDKLIAVTGPGGEMISGSWSLQDDGTSLRFPFVQANAEYTVGLKAGLLAADGRTLGHAAKREIYSGDLQAAVGFASHGSVLPARGTRGLPVVSVNVHDADVQFFRAHDDALSDLFCAYPRNGHRDNYELDHDVSYYNRCGKGDEARSKLPLTQIADPVYATHYTLGGKRNERTVTYLPMQNVKQLTEPGVYMAVLKAGDSFKGGYDTATFFVSDLGLHLRVYRNNVLLHVASLRDGKPVGGVDVQIRNADGRTTLKATTDADGNALIDYQPQSSDVLVARHGKDISVLPFSKPALDVSNFDITGRRQAPFEVYAWSSRDLYRPGEALHVSALLRDFDGKPMKPQSLFVRIKQPDGRTLMDKRLEPKDLNYFDLTLAIPEDAPTGLWQMEFRLDPSAKESVQAFPFHVEEFLPERLKVALSSPQKPLAPGEPLKLKVDSTYLYGAPAAGNRFTAKLLVDADVHPVESMKDTFP